MRLTLGTLFCKIALILAGYDLSKAKPMLIVIANRHRWKVWRGNPTSFPQLIFR